MIEYQDVSTKTDSELLHLCESLDGSNEDATDAVGEYLNRHGSLPIGTYRITKTLTLPPSSKIAGRLSYMPDGIRISAQGEHQP